MRRHLAPALIAAISLAVYASPARAESKWSTNTITYSYSNLFDGDMQLGSNFTDYEMVLAIEEALGLWASVTPLVFVEDEDSGPMPVESFEDCDGQSYSSWGRPKIRIGHHAFSDRTLGHAYYPPEYGFGRGLSGDLHFDGEDRTWSEKLFLYVAAHELGHTIGVEHIDDPPDGPTAVMNPTAVPSRFGGLGGGKLYPPDVEAVQALYGEGTGRVTTQRAFTGSGNDNLWSTHDNWDPGWMPTGNSDVTIDRGNVVRVDAAVNAANVDLAAATLEIASGGEVAVKDTFTMTRDSHLISELGATQAGRVTAGGNVTLDGTMTLLIDGSSPFQEGDYPLITTSDPNGISGRFDLVSNLGAYVDVSDDGLTYQTDLVKLTILDDLHPGDADLDAATDVRDFNAWNAAKFTSGAGWTGGDFDGDGITDVRDFNLWNAAKFTSIHEPAVAGRLQAVPEPGTLWLLAAAFVAFRLWRRRRP